MEEYCEHMAIAVVADFETTVGVVGKIVGADFEKDQSGYYEEFPAYIADVGNIQYTLLGHPDPEYDITDTPKDIFGLMVKSTDEAGIACRIAA